jgi:UDP-N-acetylglucosamine 2-epimerase
MLSRMAKRIDIITVAGTRPEIIKLSEFIKLFGNENHAYVYTGQHFSNNMSEIFFDELKTQFDYDLHCNTSEINVMKEALVKFFKIAKPKFVITYGDTNSSMATALAAKEVNTKLIHLEAGIRAFDLIPEERIRLYIDSVADYMLAPTDLAKTFLKYEGRTRNVFVPGNLITDVCKKMIEVSKTYDKKILETEYVLLTLHRQENVDDSSKLKMLIKHLEGIRHKVIFPIHPRTKNNMVKNRLKFPSNVVLKDAMGYAEFLSLLRNCKLVLTDSGGVIEEAIILGKPCITFRRTTERWETILLKANILFQLDRKDSLNDVINSMLQTRMPSHHPYGENVTKKTVRLLNKITSGA